MTTRSPSPNDSNLASPNAGPSPGSPRAALLARHPWVAFILPLAVFMVGTYLAPTPGAAPDPAQPEQTAEQEPWFGIAIPYSAYPYIYTATIALTIAAVAFVWPVYRQFPLRLSPVAILFGVVGVVAWVGLCHLQIESRVLPAVGLKFLLGMGQRSGFNPLLELASQPAWAYGFLAIRFIGLALVVPIIEEFFLRGFVMRFCVSEKWEEVPFGTVNRLAVIVGTLLPITMHPPVEWLAAGVWFSMITLLMIRTRNIWDCVAAHAVTNLLMGIYAVGWDHWELM